ncbi:hypothetical protein [Hymenobacter weizhouensis]|uniref:hypothetical protein n=1 Tax=Hymenobacter sp. YIM 151500-1 TaxID=2987689 RepID=UPI00222661AE|nr:hypothetical protein [Hymenobacter sp. YIM 151500-1]UYZ62114.1 hypothetical protein OIS53_13995 [Hymenobacter sp. YIM 151500-1]
MKNFIHPVLPALALLTLGSCAGTSALTTTESDGVYYSSKDRTTATAVATAARTAPAEATEEAPAAAGDEANPDYSENATASVGRGGSSEYYDDDYTYASRLRRFHQPYRGMSLGYYDFVYTDPFWYGGPAYSPWGWGSSAFYDPFFYDPFWGPSVVNINIGFGRPWGGGWRRPWGYSPYDYGYGYGGLGYGWGGRPWGWGNGWGNGWNNGYNTGFYNGYYRGLNTGSANVPPARPAVTGTRSSRSANATEGFSGGGNTSGVTGSRSRSTGTVDTGGILAPGGTGASSATPAPSSGRGRVSTAYPDGATPGTAPSGAGRVAETVPADQPVRTRRWRTLDNADNGSTTPGTSAPAPGYEPSRSRRSGWDNASGTRRQAAEASGDAAEPRRERTYQQPARSYSEPSQSYSEPSRSRSYSEPSRSYSEPSRSYSPPSSSPSGGSYNGGGSSGTRSSGGGGGRGRGE